MRHFSLLAASTLIASAFAIVPEGIINGEKSSTPGRQSLPNLFTVSTAKDLTGWELSGSLELDAGRLALKKGQGALWSKEALANSPDEWVIETVFRNSETVETTDHSFVDTNGLAFWLLQSQNTRSFKKDVSNFGGPAVFDGFQFLINNKEKAGLKIFAGDGTKEIPNQLDNALGTCTFNYLDSMVPFTLRISYSTKNKWFKVQIDNNLCFKTDAISFANLPQDFDFGVTGSVDGKSEEYWEVLRMSVFSGLTEDAIDDHGLWADGAVKVVTKTQEEESKETHHTPAKVRQSLMERTMKWKEELLRKQREQGGPEQPIVADEPQQDGTNIAQEQAINVDFSEITSKLSNVEELINKLHTTDNTPDLSVLNQIVESQLQQIKILESLKDNYRRLEQSIQNQNNEIVKSILQEFRNHREELGSIGKQVQSLANSGVRSEQASSIPPVSYDAFQSLSKWVLITIIVIIVALSVVVHRLRKDVKHSKLL